MIESQHVPYLPPGGEHDDGCVGQSDLLVRVALDHLSRDFVEERQLRVVPAHKLERQRLPYADVDGGCQSSIRRMWPARAAFLT